MHLELYLNHFTPLLLQQPAPHLSRLAAAGRWQREDISLTGRLLANFAIAQQNDWPSAALTAHALGLGQEGQTYFHAHYVHLDLRTDYFALQALDDVSLPQSEALLHSLNQHFASRGMHFMATPKPGCLLLQSTQANDIQTVDMAAVWGKDIRHWMPEGNDALHWRMCLNEVQMLLHAHPVHQQREQAGQLPINSIWLEGGGVLPKQVLQTDRVLMSDSSMVAGLAQLAGCTHVGLVDNFAALTYQDHLMIVLDTPEDLDTQWIAPMLEALRGATIQSLSCHFAVANQTYSLTVRPLDCWKFWRRRAPLMHYFSEQNFPS